MIGWLVGCPRFLRDIDAVLCLVPGLAVLVLGVQQYQIIALRAVASVVCCKTGVFFVCCAWCI